MTSSGDEGPAASASSVKQSPKQSPKKSPEESPKQSPKESPEPKTRSDDGKEIKKEEPNDDGEFTLHYFTSRRKTSTGDSIRASFSDAVCACVFSHSCLFSHSSSSLLFLSLFGFGFGFGFASGRCRKLQKGGQI